ncbi:hypothetical protein DMP23_00055 [Amycolatopsis sp. A1MSW2902]|uniref:hypothetical protein n=1 Tax=Amycolatopsis sp. A1MSW2902 TaxID=687413 RepID=UPI00307F8F16
MARQASTAAGVLNLLPVAVTGSLLLPGVLPLAVAGGFALAGAMIAAKLGADGAKAAFKQLDPQLNTLKSGVSASFKDALLPAVHNLQTLLRRQRPGSGPSRRRWAASLRRSPRTSRRPRARRR